MQSEKPVFAPGAAAVRSTRMVNLYADKELHDVKRCHFNARVFDLGWERGRRPVPGAKRGQKLRARG